MTKKLLFILLVITMSVVPLIACTGEESSPTAPTTPGVTTTTTAPTTPEEPTKEQEVKVIKLKFAHIIPVMNVVTVNFQEMCDNIMAMSDGRIEITHYPGGSLMKYGTEWDGCISGTIDMAISSPAGLSSVWRLMSVVELPLLDWTNPRETKRITYELYEAFPETKQEGSEVQVIGFRYHEPQTLHFRDKEIHVPADMKGLKMGVSGKVLIDTVEAWGAVPVSVTTADMFEAMQRGTVEGTVRSWYVGGTHGWWESTKTHTDVSMGESCGITVMNKEVWNSLSPGLQEIILMASWKAHEESAPLNIWAGRQEKKKYSDQTVIIPTSDELKLWRDSVKPVWDKWVDDREKDGLPAQAVLDWVVNRIEMYREADGSLYRYE